MSQGPCEPFTILIEKRPSEPWIASSWRGRVAGFDSRIWVLSLTRKGAIRKTKRALKRHLKSQRPAEKIEVCL